MNFGDEASVFLLCLAALGQPSWEYMGKGHGKNEIGHICGVKLEQRVRAIDGETSTSRCSNLFIKTKGNR